MPSLDAVLHDILDAAAVDLALSIWHLGVRIASKQLDKVGMPL
jgi:hypothetical protein